MRRVFIITLGSIAALCTAKASANTLPQLNQPPLIALPAPIAETHLGNKHWFLGLGGAVDFLILDKKTSFLSTTQTISGYTPNPPDSFTLANMNNPSGMFSASVGQTWKTTNDRLIHLFFEYDEFSRITASGQRLAFNIVFPGNQTTYSYNISHRAFLLGTKVDFSHWKKFMPYLETGIGISQNHFSTFNNNVNQNQIYPFPNHEINQFGCELGAGLDWLATKNMILGAGYRFGYWGDIKSGSIYNAFPPGGALPTPIQLSQTLYSNQLLIKATYLF